MRRPCSTPAVGSFAQRLGMRGLTDHHPAPVFAALVLCGFLLVAAATAGLGFLLVDGILSIGAIAHADEHVNTWLAAHRTSGLTEASSVGSEIGSGFVIPAVVAVAVVWFALRRHWRAAAFVLAAILVEVTSYRVTTLLVHRHRPAVHRLEHLPVNASFPSGHVAASVAVYGGLALLLTSRYKNPWLRSVVWALGRGTADCSRHLEDVSGHAPSSRRPRRSRDGTRGAADRAVRCPGNWSRGRAAGPSTARPGGWHEHRRGRRSYGQEHRRRPARATARARTRGHQRSALVRGFQEPAGAETSAPRSCPRCGCDLRLGRRRAGTALYRHPRRHRCHPCDRSSRHREPAGVEPRHPRRDPRGRRDRALRHTSAGSTSAP